LWVVIVQLGVVVAEAGRRPEAVSDDYLYYKLFDASSVVIDLQAGGCRGR
jgi:hypothetical protein